MWIKFLTYVNDVSSPKKYGLEFYHLCKEFGLDEVKRDLALEEELDTMYWVYQFKKELREKNFANAIDTEDMKNFINDFVSTQTIVKKKQWGYYNKIQSLYQKFFGYEYLNVLNKLDTIVFDLKKKQLYSNFLKNSSIKKFLTNGTLLSKLRIFVKNKKKSMTIYGYNIKDFFNQMDKKNFVIEIVGCKHHIFKIIKFIKKYHKFNSLFIFTPRRSFFKNQYKKISSIKRKMSKRYARYIRL